MLIQIDLQSDVPLYMQLTNQVIEGIASGQLLPGETLPSVRALGSDLGINLHTVNKAYSILKQEGFIQVHRQKGALINPEPIPPADDLYFEKLAEKLRPLVAESICRHVTEGQFAEICQQLYEKVREGRDHQ